MLIWANEKIKMWLSKQMLKQKDIPELCFSSYAEVSFFKDAVNHPRISTLFEFGCGGSTVFAASFTNVKTIHSVDSSLEWINRIKKDATTRKKTKFYYIDINSDNERWGYPKDNSKVKMWSQYSSALKKTGSHADMVFIDGRFRVACALKSFSSMKDDACLMFHDYPHRPHYHIIEKYFQKHKSCSILYTFKKKENINFKEMVCDIQTYETDPR